MILPKPSTLLRELVTRAGLRPAFTDKGVDKDLDDMATDGRPSSTGDLMLSLEAQLIQLLKAECGGAFAEFCQHTWSITREAIQTLAQNVDTSTIADDQGATLVQREFNIPILYAFADHVAERFPGPERVAWWASPFSAWMSWTAGRTGIAEAALRERLMVYFKVDQKSVERWQTGRPIEGFKYPYREKLIEMIANRKKIEIESEIIDQIAIWLVLAISFQSLPAELRSALRSYGETRDHLSWTPEEAIYELNVSAASRGQGPIFEATAPLVLKITELLSEPELDQTEVQRALSKFKSIISSDLGLLKRGCQFTYDRLAAKFAARTGRQVEALELYNAAVEGAWWYGGPAQKRIIHEALVYAVGVKDNAAVVERYWDKASLLGLKKWPKRPLDEQERRLLAMGFEREFQGQKAQDRVPPRFEITLPNDPFIVSKGQIKNPNQKTKFAEGRTRRTPLMQAIQQGTLADVKRLHAAGAKANDFIPESGQGPLSTAMYRARDQKDSSIMEYLLSLDLSAETVNRQFSTRRETPLKLAIEMANASAVNRLIDLGANLEVDCEQQPSALCYAVGLFYASIHTDDRSQERAYYEGKGGTDVYDAKDGAVLDADLAARRQAMAALRYASPENARIFNFVREYFTPSVNDLREVIHVLLKRGANANQPYKVDADSVYEWTPTLFAAQIGDLDIFEALIEAGGDYTRTLTASSPLKRQDALWIAVEYKRDSIVNFLRRKLDRSIQYRR